MSKVLTQRPNMDNTLYNPNYEHDNCGAGFVCSLNGEKSNSIIHKALQILERLEHRGAVSSDGRTGDGAGVMIDIPHDFFVKSCPEIDFPEQRQYAVGMVFLPNKENQIKYIIDQFNHLLMAKGVELLGWRDVPVVSEELGVVAQRTEPTIKQIFVKRPKDISDLEFRKKLFVVRKIIENKIWNSKLSQKDFFYLPSFSDRTIIYKGLIRPDDMSNYFVDLKDPTLTTRLALVHQRFSTNTFPSWDLAHPFRYICHNGEINTLRGNISRMRSREELFTNDNFFGEDFTEMLPIIKEGKSDSASMDMVVELLLMTGRTLPEVMMMMVPEAWEKDANMQEEKKDFYLYNSCIMEPWDGPASIPFTDGDFLGALLDRNGLRPSRYSVTKDGYVIMSSETGVLDIKPENVLYHGRLEPGKMFLVDMNKGEIIEDYAIKKEVTGKQNWKQWINNNLLELDKLPEPTEKTPTPFLDLFTRKKLFGFTDEQIQSIVHPMMEKGKEPIGSMGMDAPIAVLSEKPQLLFNYFKQLFAQVTNPPLDGIREEIITDISMVVGADSNVFTISESHCKKLKIKNPILSNDELNRIKSLQNEGLKSAVIPTLYNHTKGTDELQKALDQIISQAIKEIDNGASIIILSDRGATAEMVPIPSLLSCSYLHHSLNQFKKRSKCDIIVESGEPREIHHYACLFGYGASAICPFLLYEILEEELKSDQIHVNSFQEAVKNYQKAVEAGVIKVMNKIGISTLRSYHSAQIFEALGLSKDFADKYFPYTSSRIKGIGILQVHKEILMRVENAFPKNQNLENNPLEVGGEYRWRRNGEEHMFNPLSVAKLQQAVRQNKPIVYKEFADMINKQSERLMTIRGLLDFGKFDPVPIDEVEPWTEIVKRFKTGAMSYGSISKEAHENLAIAMNRIGGKSNSGEGGEFAARFQKDQNGDWRNSAIKQVASGRFGVTSNYLTNAKEIQIKMAQGAKPGEGGQLPGEKIDPTIAACRHSTPWVGLISPPPHHDIYSIEDLSQLIYDLKNANREARINVKLVSEVGVGTVAAGVAKAKADVILISGYDGGTGASPLTSLKHAGLPWELGLAEAQQTLVMNDLRSRVVLECDGQLKTGRDVAIACLLGAEEFGFATAPLVASGCIMMRVCHLNTCPVGVATQDPELRKKFTGKPEHVINFFYFVAQELREIMADLGFRTIDEMVGRVDKLQHNKATKHYKAKKLDLSAILKKVDVPDYVQIRNTMKQNHQLEEVLDIEILHKTRMSIVRKDPVELHFPVKNTDRSIGAILSNEISKIYGEKGLEEDTLKLNFKGSAGQSFGVFTTSGVTLNLEGDANDYVGKGLSGGKIIIKKPKEATFPSHENVIMGNVAFYGAISGEAYINGLAGERFCVRNSGVKAVVEGIGDHGCEYMTGGIAVILGKTGRNFAAGMSGGVAYVLDESEDFVSTKCNLEMVDIDPLDENDLAELNGLISNHFNYTNSAKAGLILDDWTNSSKKFVKVMPRDYKKALELMKKQEATIS
jgi:glutamate synthase (NADPH) large chain